MEEIDIMLATLRSLVRSNKCFLVGSSRVSCAAFDCGGSSRFKKTLYANDVSSLGTKLQSRTFTSSRPMRDMGAIIGQNVPVDKVIVKVSEIKLICLQYYGDKGVLHRDLDSLVELQNYFKTITLGGDSLKENESKDVSVRIARMREAIHSLMSVMGLYHPSSDVSPKSEVSEFSKGDSVDTYDRKLSHFRELESRYEFVMD